MCSHTAAEHQEGHQEEGIHHSSASEAHHHHHLDVSEDHASAASVDPSAEDDSRTVQDQDQVSLDTLDHDDSGCRSEVESGSDSGCNSGYGLVAGYN